MSSIRGSAAEAASYHGRTQSLRAEELQLSQSRDTVTDLGNIEVGVQGRGGKSEPKSYSSSPISLQVHSRRAELYVRVPTGSVSDVCLPEQGCSTLLCRVSWELGQAPEVWFHGISETGLRFYPFNSFLVLLDALVQGPQLEQGGYKVYSREENTLVTMTDFFFFFLKGSISALCLYMLLNRNFKAKCRHSLDVKKLT